MNGFPHAESLVVRPVNRGFGHVEVEWAQKDVEHTLIVSARLSPVGARDLAAKLLAAADRVEGTPQGNEDTDRYWWDSEGHKSACPVWGDDQMIEACTCGPRPGGVA